MYSQSTQAARRRRPAAQGDARGSRRRERQEGACPAGPAAGVSGTVPHRVHRKGVFPQRLDQLGEDILALIGSNTDFRAAFSDLGESLAEQDSVLGDIGEFCIQVFGSGRTPAERHLPPWLAGWRRRAASLTAGRTWRSSPPTICGWTGCPTAGCRGEQAEGEAAQQTPQAQTAAPAVGTVLLKANYNGPELPANYTMDQISLGTWRP